MQSVQRLAKNSQVGQCVRTLHLTVSSCPSRCRTRAPSTFLLYMSLFPVVPAAHVPGMMTRLFLSGAHALKTCSEMPPCSMPGVANSTQGPSMLTYSGFQTWNRRAGMSAVAWEAFRVPCEPHSFREANRAAALLAIPSAMNSGTCAQANC